MIAGRYTLDREIGRGGMGAVWLGRDEVLGRAGGAQADRAWCPGGSSPDLERAEREARLAARLNHPHVVAVFDLVDEGDAAVAGDGVRRGRRRSPSWSGATAPLTPDEAAPLLRAGRRRAGRRARAPASCTAT